MRVVPNSGHWILAGGLVVAAMAPVMLCYATAVSQIGLAFILLDFGCGCGQVANTLMVWVQSEGATQWLNILNGSFGVGTLVSPALVAMLDLMLGSTSAAVEAALLVVPMLVLFIAGACISVPSPLSPLPNDSLAGSSKDDADAEAPREGAGLEEEEREGEGEGETKGERGEGGGVVRIQEGQGVTAGGGVGSRRGGGFDGAADAAPLPRAARVAAARRRRGRGR